MSTEALTVHDNPGIPTTLADVPVCREYVAVYFDEGYTFLPFTLPSEVGDGRDAAEEYYREEYLDGKESDDRLGEDMLLTCCPCDELPLDMQLLWQVNGGESQE